MRFIPVGTGNTVWRLLVCAGFAVHPRGHGEHLLTVNSPSTSRGSSPWARGTRLNTMMMKRRSRFIPVGTGNT